MSALRQVLAVGLGGGLGALTRYGVALALSGMAVAFPVPTLLINVSGCFALGLLMGAPAPVLAEWPFDARLFIGVGFLGGYTTFSTFGLETVRLLKADRPAAALAYVGLSVVLGVLAAYGGMKMAGAPPS